MGALVTTGLPLESLRREAVEAHIEALIALLDDLDGNLDLEPDNDDEPILGWPEGVVARTGTGLDDREPDGDEDEPELGSPEASPHIRLEPPDLEYRRPMPLNGSDLVHDRGSSQLQWSKGGTRDLERDGGDEGEPDSDEEEWCQPATSSGA